MTKENFDSSDSARNAKPLQHARSVTFDRPLALAAGGVLPSVTTVFETFGRLNEACDNAVLICHALTGDSHVTRHDEQDDSGWWEIFVGPGKPVDTDRYFVICPNILGGCRGTTGPNSINPETGESYGADFPVITIGDMVQVQKRLIEHLGIKRLRAVIGGSLGGHMALTWAAQFPEAVAGVVLLATSPRLTSQALAFDVVGRNAILRDPAYHNGQYYDKGQGQGPLVGLAIARMLGHITYLSREAMTEKFDAHRLEPRDIRTNFETKFAVGSYLAYQGDRFGERFDPNSYLAITMAMDLFDVGGSRQALSEAFRKSDCRWLIMSFTSDWLFPPFQSREIVDALLAENKPVSYCNIESNCGHDAFLLPNELPVYGEMARSFLAHLDEPADAHAAEGGPSGEAAGLSPTSIFHRYRLDYQSILELIPEGAGVLDLGCGTGGLLARLRDRGHQHLVGLELDQQAILTCIDRGLDVVQSDLNKGLAAFSDRQFDFVVLSQTLQAVVDVERVVTEMLRVGQRAIVSFPNFAFRKLRERLFHDGRSPQMAASHGFSWYNTPNVRLPSITDFEEFCRNHDIRILQQINLNTEADVRVTEDPNLNADVAVMVLSR